MLLGRCLSRAEPQSFPSAWKSECLFQERHLDLLLSSSAVPRLGSPRPLGLHQLPHCSLLRKLGPPSGPVSDHFPGGSRQVLPVDALLGPQGWEPLSVFLRVCDSREAIDTQVPWFQKPCCSHDVGPHILHMNIPAAETLTCASWTPVLSFHGKGWAVAYGRVAHWVPPGSPELSLFPAPSLPPASEPLLQSMVTVCVRKRERATEEPWDLRMLADSNYFAGDKADSGQSGSLAKSWGRSWQN